MIKIGFDLDGVIIDNTVFKSDVFYKKTGLHLKNWNLNSNVIDNYISNIDLRREIDKLSATSIHKITTEKNVDKILLKIKSSAEIYLISSRGKSEDGLLAAQQTIEKLKIAHLFGNNIFFVKNDFEKIIKIQELSLDYFIDDRFDVISMLSENIGILYDQFNQWEKYKNYIVIKSLLDIIPLIQSLKDTPFLGLKF